MSSKMQPKRRRRPPAEILAPMLAICDRNGWHAVAEALRGLSARWEALEQKRRYLLIQAEQYVRGRQDE